MRRLIPFALALTLAPRTAPAQALLDRAVRLGPQFVSYKLGTIDTRISELAIPIAAVMPVASRFNMDIATAYASSQVTSGSTRETIQGLTDTQVRANYTVGSDFIVLTAGLNLPSGQATVRENQFRAAGYIGNDFFAFPISSLGSGFATTGGVAVARPFGAWNVGFGASMRYSAAYDAFEVGSNKVNFQPGNEYRARFGLDRAIRTGRAAVGMTYSTFGRDAAGQSTYSTGDRLVLQGAYSAPVQGVDLFISGWNLFRFAGQRAGGIDVPAETVTNLAVSAGFRALGTTLEPNVEVRNWSADGRRAGTMALIGMRSRFALGGITAYPGVSLATGSLVLPGSGSPGATANETASITGYRATLTMRYTQ